MKIEIKQISNGLQHINRLSFVGSDNKEVYVDLFDDEVRELREQINQAFSEVKE
jgi:hypothetical protein